MLCVNMHSLGDCPPHEIALKHEAAFVYLLPMTWPIYRPFGTQAIMVSTLSPATYAISIPRRCFGPVEPFVASIFHANHVGHPFSVVLVHTQSPPAALQPRWPTPTTTITAKWPGRCCTRPEKALSGRFASCELAPLLQIHGLAGDAIG